MLTQLPRWSRTRAERLRARGTSDAILHHIFCSGAGKANARRVHADDAMPASSIIAHPISVDVDGIAESRQA